VKAALYDPIGGTAFRSTSRQRGLPTKRKRARIYNRTSHRLREIERIIEHRYGVVPDTDDADIILDQVACCILHMMRKKTGRKPDHAELVDRLNLWCERWADETSIRLRSVVAREVLRRPRLDCADECAAKLRLSYDERTLLGITTIGSYDVDKRGRAKRRKARKLIRDRKRAATKRAERGAVPRSEYLATSLSTTQPWKEEGISRRTWERRRRRAFFSTLRQSRGGMTQVRRPAVLPLCWATHLRHRSTASGKLRSSSPTLSLHGIRGTEMRSVRVAASARPMLVRTFMLATSAPCSPADRSISAYQRRFVGEVNPL